MKLICRFAVSLLIFACALVFAAEPALPSAPQKDALPAEFGGWHLKGSLGKSTDPVTADEANAPVLKEYGFQRFEKASYTSDDGRTLDLKAAMFGDATGAYGAFTFYKTPPMLNEKIGNGQASSLNNRVLLYQGNILIDAVFSKLTVMSAAELRELAGMLPQPSGNARNLPSLPVYLPKQSYEKNTAKYVLGPAGLNRVGAPLPTSLVDFKSGAEVVVAKYAVAGGEASLMLIEYPTPQLAAQRVKEIDAAHQPVQQGQPGTPPIVDVGPFFDKRTGPIIVIASGPLSQKEANSLLESINYEADVTWNENTYVSKKDNLANLLFNVIVLCAILIGFALVAGLAFGGFRILMKRIFPDRVFDRPEDIEIISLHLGSPVEPAPERR